MVKGPRHYWRVWQDAEAATGHDGAVIALLFLVLMVLAASAPN